MIVSSRVAIQSAALIPMNVRERNYLGTIVLTADERWVAPDPESVRLSGKDVSAGSKAVHPELEADEETFRALKELGIRPASPETLFKDLAAKLLDLSPYYFRVREDSETGSSRDWQEFWRLASELERFDALDAIKAQEMWRDALRIRTIAGNWKSLFNALLPGRVVPKDGSRDSDIAIDVGFHEANLPLLRLLGAVDTPHSGREVSRGQLTRFTGGCRREFHFAFT